MNKQENQDVIIRINGKPLLSIRTNADFEEEEAGYLVQDKAVNLVASIAKSSDEGIEFEKVPHKS